MEELNVSRSYARFILDTQFSDMPKQAVIKAKLSLIDWLGCVAAAVNEPSSKALGEFVKEFGGTAEAEVAGAGIKAPSFMAAFANGMMAHTVESDDIYKDALYHPGAPVIAAALAVGQKVEATGQELLRAIIIGYEISNRIGKAVNPSHYNYFHTTGTVGTFGAAAAAAALLGLTEDQVISCLGLAGTSAAALWESNGTNGKPFHAGKAAQNGTMAALLAAKGITGPEKIIEGKKGFMKAMSRSDNYDTLIEGLGSYYTIIDVSTKYYGSCGHTFAPIDAALNVLEMNDIDIVDIVKIYVKTYQAAIEVAGNSEPGTAYQSKFSISYCVAAAVKFGKVFRNEFQDQYLADSEIRKLMAAVEVSVGQELEEIFPAKRGASVEIVTNKGSYIDTVYCRKGDPGNPLTEEEFFYKYTELIGEVLSDLEKKQTFDQIQAIDTNNSIDWVLTKFIC